MKILKETDDKIDYIVHLSDIHLRLNSRFPEYNYCFDQVYSKLEEYKRQNKKCLIVVCGDIVHSKTELSPELCIETINFFFNLCKFYDTLVIAGNHDFMMTNRTRIDSLTSILHKRSPSNLYYLKETDKYKYNNCLFYVDSLLDDKGIDMKTKDEEEYNKYYKVALYHGGVSGWKTNQGFTSTDSTDNRKISDFMNMDLVCLGDIHMYQILNEKKPKILYSSSLISQNFGETDLNHGFLLHNLSEESHEYIIINNPYRHQDIYVKDDEMIVTDQKTLSIKNEEYLHHIALKGNIRIFYNMDTQELVARSLQEYLKKKLPHAKFVLEHVNLKKKKEESSSNTDNDNRTNSTQEYIKEYLQRLIPEKDKENERTKIETYILNLFLSHSNHVNNIQWNFLSLKFSNMFSYGKDNVIDLKNCKENIIGVYGRNGYGKSSIIDIITSVLFDKISRLSNNNSIAKEIINFNEKKASASLQLQIGEQEFEIQKDYTRNKANRIIIKTTLFEISKSQNTKVELTGEQRMKTNKVIETIVGKYESFIFFHLFLQKKDLSFRDFSPTRKKQFLHDVFGHSWMEKVEKEHKEKLKTLEIEYKVYSEKHNELSDYVFKEELNTLQGTHNEYKLSINRKKSELENIEKEISELYCSLINCNKETSIDSIENKIQQLKRKCNEYEETIKTSSVFLEKWQKIDFRKRYDVYQNSHPELLERYGEQKTHLHSVLTSSQEVDIADRLQDLYKQVNSNIKFEEDLEIESFFSIANKNIIAKEMSDLDIDNRYEEFYNDIKNCYNLLTHKESDISKENFVKKKREIVYEKDKKRELLSTKQKKYKKYEVLQRLQESIPNFMHQLNQFKEDPFFQAHMKKTKEEWKLLVDNIIVEKQESYEKLQENLKESQEYIDKVKEALGKISFNQNEKVISKGTYLRYKEENINVNENENENEMNCPISVLQENLSNLEIYFFEMNSSQQKVELYKKTIKDCCDVRIKINKECQACLSNPYNKKRIELEKEKKTFEKEFEKIKIKYKNCLEKFRKDISSFSTDKDILLLLNNDNNIIIPADVREIIKKKREKEKQKQLMEKRNQQMKDYESKKECDKLQRCLENGISEKEKIEVRQKKLVFYLKHKETISFLDKLYNFNGNVNIMSISMNTTSDHRKLEQEIQKIEKELVEINQLEKDTLKAWQKDFELIQEIRTMENSLSNFKKKEKWLHYLEQKQIYTNNILLEREIEKLELMKEKQKEVSENKSIFNFLQQVFVTEQKLTSCRDLYTNIVTQSDLHKTTVSDLSKSKQLIKDLQHDVDILARLRSKEKQKQKLQEFIESINSNIIENALLIEQTSMKQAIFNEMKEKMENIKHMIALEKQYIQIFDKDGLPLFLLNKNIHCIERKMNEMLTIFLPKKKVVFRISTDNQVEFGFQHSTENNYISAFTSGAEGFLLDVVLKYSLSLFSQCPKTNIFFIDEQLSVLDKERISNINRLFGFFKSIGVNVFVITHLTSIRDYVEKLIIVDKDDKNYSCLTFA